MSAGPYLRAIYELNSGLKAPIRIQPETGALVFGTTNNTVPAGPADIPVSARVSNNNRSIGIKPRTVTVRFNGAGPEGYSPQSTITLPWLAPATWEALAVGTVGQYLGVAVTLVGKAPERVR